MNETLKTLCQQIGMSKLAVMIGASHMVYSNTDNYIGFRFKMNTKMNHCKIQYDDGNDAYSMTFSKVGRVNFKEVKEIKWIYAEQLNNVFESETGLATHL